MNTKNSILNDMKVPIISVITIAMALCLITVWHAGLAKAIFDGSTGQHYSVLGDVSAISTSSPSLSLASAAASDGSPVPASFDLGSVSLIESSARATLSLGDVQPGDKVILQGLSSDGSVTISRIIDFSWSVARAAMSAGNDASTTATTTSDAATEATSTDSTASSTPDTIASSTESVASSTESTASSSPSLEATSTDATASSTPSSDSQSASSTASTDDSNTASSTLPDSSPATSTPDAGADQAPAPSDAPADASTTNS